jgi:hypothetical protein
MFSFLQSSALVSHVKVELTDAQWDAVTSIFKNIGAATDYVSRRGGARIHKTRSRVSC